MKHEICGLEPQLLWSFFYDLTQIPRPSKKESLAVEYVIDFARNNGLAYERDDLGNVVIRKPASQGMEDCVPVILQAHLDMVPQKNSGNNHNFETDPLKPCIVDGWVKATETTLGADNGIGAASILAVLKSDTITHGSIEALFTVDEEAGMGGARNLKPGWLKGKMLINTDSEEEGELFVGCGGAATACCSFRFQQQDVPNNMVGYSISITGLKGGHSGLDIHRGRGNANKLLFRVLKNVVARLGCRLSTVEGGSLRNAIPREAFATVAVPKDNIQRFENEISRLQQLFITELGNVETNIKLTTMPIDGLAFIMDAISQDNLINAIQACPNGVIRMDDTMPDAVETSTNLATIHTQNNEVVVTSLIRSAIDSAKDDVCSTIDSLFSLADAKVSFEGGYPGWKPNPNSQLLQLVKNAYSNLYGRQPLVKSIHAGLECGIFGGIYPHWDMISFGPTIRFPHSPDEKVNIESVSLYWNLLVDVLRTIPKDK